MANSSSLMIIYSFFSRFCTSPSSSHCIAKASWSYLDISVLSYGGIEMAITAYNSLWELIYHLFGNGFVDIYFCPIFGRQFQKFVLFVLQQCDEDCVIISGRSTPFEISSCAIELVDGAHFKCKCKCWFVFYAFLWTCRETAKYQALVIVYCAHAGALKGW